MTKPVRSKKTPTASRKTGVSKKSGSVVPDNKATASRQQVRQEIHRT